MVKVKGQRGEGQRGENGIIRVIDVALSIMPVEEAFGRRYLQEEFSEIQTMLLNNIKSFMQYVLTILVMLKCL